MALTKEEYFDREPLQISQLEAIIIKRDERIASLRDLIGRALPYFNNKNPMCNAECLGMCTACRIKREIGEASCH